MTRAWIPPVALVGLLLILPGLPTAEIAAQQAPAASKGDIKVLPLRGNLYLLTVRGANIAASVGKDGVVLVDSGPEDMADQVLAAVRDLSRRVTSMAMPLQSCVGITHGCSWWSGSQLLPTTANPPAPRPIIGIINTSDDLDRIGGNAVVSKAGRAFGVRNAVGENTPAWVVGHENVSLRLAKADKGALVPTEGYFGREKKLNFINGEGVIVSHPVDSGITDGDSLVHFRGSDVLVAGDVFDMSQYPRIDLARGGSIEGVVETLNWILDLAVVEHMMEGGTLIVPGHGRMADSADVGYYRDMVTIFRDRVRAMIDKGMSLEQIKAARPTRDYDHRFGKNPKWTPNMFVEAVYKSLNPKS